jgi:hypothetical protein
MTRAVTRSRPATSVPTPLTATRSCGDCVESCTFLRVVESELSQLPLDNTEVHCQSLPWSHPPWKQHRGAVLTRVKAHVRRAIAEKGEVATIDVKTLQASAHGIGDRSERQRCARSCPWNPCPLPDHWDEVRYQIDREDEVAEEEPHENPRGARNAAVRGESPNQAKRVGKQSHPFAQRA